MTRLVLGLVATAAALRWWHKGPYRIRNPRELNAINYTTRSLATITIAYTVGATMSAAAIGYLFLESTTAATLAGFTALVWTPQLSPPLIEAGALANYRRRRNRAALFFLRKLRLGIASGDNVRTAAQVAAQQMTDRTFSDVAAAVDRAVRSGRSPLEAIARQLAGSGVETLLAATAAAERSGAGASGRLDNLIVRALSALEDERRITIDKLGRRTSTVSTATTMLATLPLILSIVATLNTV